MQEEINNLRITSRKLVRELGLLEPNIESNDTLQHRHALIEVSRNKNLTVSKLSNLLLMSVSNASRIINRLVEDDLVKYNNSLDRREKYLELTEKGTLQIKKIDEFSNAKILGAFEFLTEEEKQQLIKLIAKYAESLEKSRLLIENVKISTLSTARTIRKQIVTMTEKIQINEFNIPVTEEINACILKAEECFYYNNSYNFWYATDSKGEVIGSIGLKKINEDCGEVKKFFVKKEFRGKRVAQKLMIVLKKAAIKHGFKYLYLGTVDVLKAAHRFYEKIGFFPIAKSNLPKEFELCFVDNMFYKIELDNLKL